jgi:eukaryotic-like serine/threonine-protein kinase
MSLEKISHYRVDRLIAVGGMGEVYLAEDATLRRKVALKLLPERFTGDAERVRRFQREARAASALNHPNIITIYEVGEDDKRHYIASEYIEGQTLRARIKSTQRMTVGEVLDISIGIASAMAAAHEAGILHRDIKPENIMMRPDGYVKVLDFGLAKLVENDSVKDSTTGAVMGTLLYLSPEQARGQAPDARSDIYSIGAVMYEMLTRQAPINTDNFVELAIAIATRDPEPPSKLAANVPPDLDRIILKALQKDPAKRYTAVRDMLDDLRSLRRELEFEDKLSSYADRRSSGSPLQLTAPLRAYDRTSGGLFSHRTESVMPRQLLVIVLLLLCASIIAYAVGRSGLFSDHPINSIVVLPFLNASGDPRSDYLSDGIAESVTNTLSHIPQLQVIARSTATKYKGKNVDPLEVGRKLHVRGVVSGRLLKNGETLVIRASLTDVDKGTQIWGEQYNRKFADVLIVQREMSEQISNELQLKLSGDEMKEIKAIAAPESPQAYQAYLKGRYYYNSYTEESVRKSLTFFTEAIGADPTYALAYAGLASAYYFLSNLYMAPREAMPRAREAAERAVRIDAHSADAHAALALVRTWYDWDFVAGEREFRRALLLNPNDADAHRFYGDFLIVTRQFDRAISEKRRAEQLDPLSVPASFDVARALFFAGRYAEAEQQARRTLDLDEHFPPAYQLRAQIALQQNRVEAALPLLEKTMAMGGRKPFFLSMWGYANGVAGHRDKALAAIKELKASPTYTLPLFMARVNAGLGDKDEALRWLGMLYAERSESVVWLNVDPTLDSLRSDPRFIALAKRIGV